MGIRFLRWLLGYMEFNITGKFPERFINAGAKQGINFWKLRNNGDMLSAFARTGEYDSILLAAQKSKTNIHIVRYYGLPHLIKKYKNRSGLAAGLLVFILFFRIMSGYVWRITIDVPDIINEYELRNTLRDYGVYEGASSSDINVPQIINSISSSDKRISWMTVNIIGSTAEVAASPNLSEKLSDTKSPAASNMMSLADGTVTRVNVYNGSAKVKAGDGIHKGQLLVSGVIEYNNGNSVLADSNAKVFAKTLRKVQIRIPETYDTLQKTEYETTKSDISIFGIRLPLSVEPDPTDECTRHTHSFQAELLGNSLPIYSTTELWQHYKKTPVKLDTPRAEKLLINKLKLYELFMVGSLNSGKILSRKINVYKKDGFFVLDAVYETEEDVCVKSEIEVNTDQGS